MMRKVYERFHKNDIEGNRSIVTRLGYLYAVNGVIEILRDLIQQGFPITDQFVAVPIRSPSISLEEHPTTKICPGFIRDASHISVAACRLYSSISVKSIISLVLYQL
jgi:hypothetical protein